MKGVLTGDDVDLISLFMTMQAALSSALLISRSSSEVLHTLATGWRSTLQHHKESPAVQEGTLRQNPFYQKILGRLYTIIALCKTCIVATSQKKGLVYSLS